MRWVVRALAPAALLVVAVGCGADRTYDLRHTEPYSAYVGRPVRLQRSVELVERAVGTFPLQYFIHDDAHSIDPAWERGSGEITRRVTLAAGRMVNVRRPVMIYSKQPLYGLQFANVHCEVEVDSPAPGWPCIVSATFNYATGETGDWVLSAEFDSYPTPPYNIGPAPWEPVGTPARRTLPWPTTAPVTDE